MTIPTEVAAVLAEMRELKVPNWPAGRILGDLADRIESALAAGAEPAAWMTPESIAHLERQNGVAKVDAWNCADGGFRVPVFTHAKPAAKVEAPDLVLQLLVAGGFVDPAKVEQAREIIAGCAPTPASVPDGWAPTDDQFRAWCKTHDLPEHVSRAAFDDAASLYLLEPAP